jgi:triosephosphate isomerase
MRKKTIRDVELKGKKVFVRVDFNVPLDKEGHITDDSRIIASLPTINYLLDNGAKIIIASHMGRPKGKYLDELRLDPVAKRLSELLGKDVKKMDVVLDDYVKKAISNMKSGEIILLENIRMDKRETDNDLSFAEELASLADLFVNDAFGTAHRAHASTEGITKFIPSVAGLLMEKELAHLGKVLEKPEKPFVVIIGGAKVTDKIGIIENLLDTVDTILIGGGMANTFLLAEGNKIGKSLVEEEKVALAKEILEEAKKLKVNILLPVDCVTAFGLEDKEGIETCLVSQVKDDKMILDIGPETVKLYEKQLKNAKTVVWNGPMGVFEIDEFSKGTEGVAKSVANSEAFSIVGGGDSMAALKKVGLSYKITHISTGGGASLEFLEGKVLPGIEALNDKEYDKARRPVIIGNWKMHMNKIETKNFFNDFFKEFKENGLETGFCVPFTALPAIEEFKGMGVKIGAQNFYPQDKGAFTGEVSLKMLKEYDIDYIIIGHSERRSIFKEDDNLVREKLEKAISDKVTPVFCIGESLEEREEGSTEKVLTRQLETAFTNISSQDAEKIITAYEPVWAIGTGKTATKEMAEETIAFIRKWFEQKYGSKTSDRIRIQYGGSVKPENIKDFMEMPNIDGALVGGASLKSADFLALINYKEQ